MEKVVIDNDLKGLSIPQRLSYYKLVCESCGLNPATAPFNYIRDKITGKISLYANKTASAQLAKIHKIGVAIEWMKREGDELPIYFVKVRGMTPDKRITDEIGAVPLFKSAFLQDEDQDPGEVYDGRVRHEVWDDDPDTGRRRKFARWGHWDTKQLVGEAQCNAMMKAVTKAKRRLVLSMAGLGMPDESELESMNVEVVDEKELGVAREDAPPWGANDQLAEEIKDEWANRFRTAETADQLQQAVEQMRGERLDDLIGEERMTELIEAFEGQLALISSASQEDLDDAAAY